MLSGYNYNMLISRGGQRPAPSQKINLSDSHYKRQRRGGVRELIGFRFFFTFIATCLICLSVALPNSAGRRQAFDFKLPDKTAARLFVDRDGAAAGVTQVEDGMYSRDPAQVDGDAYSHGLAQAAFSSYIMFAAQTVFMPGSENSGSAPLSNIAEIPYGNNEKKTNKTFGILKYNGGAQYSKTEDVAGYTSQAGNTKKAFQADEAVDTGDAVQASVAVDTGDAVQASVANDTGDAVQAGDQAGGAEDQPRVNAGAGYVILDAGHGGHDPGSSAADIYEKNIALDVTLLTAELLDEAGVEYILTRETDEFIPIERRVESMETVTAAFVVSIHCDWYKQNEINGTSALYNAGDYTSKDLAELLLSYMTVDLGTEDRGVHPHQDIVLLCEAPIPAIIVELAFMSNAHDLSLLKTDEFRARAAQNLAGGICVALEDY